jgi:hypothetical protein
MSLPFNIRADLTLSYFVILFFNYLQGLHVQFTLSSSKIHFSSTMRIHVTCHIPPWKQHDVYYPSMGVVSACAFSFMSKYLHQSCGPKPMTRVDINDNNQSSNIYVPNQYYNMHIRSQTILQPVYTF